MNLHNHKSIYYWFLDQGFNANYSYHKASVTCPLVY